MGNDYCKQCGKKFDFQQEPIDPQITVIRVQGPCSKPILTAMSKLHLQKHQPYKELSSLNYKKQLLKISDSDNIYEGSLNNEGYLHGFGTVYFANGAIYQGQFVEGKHVGKGHYIFPEGGCIYGVFGDSIQKGKFISKDGKNRYQGQFKGRQFHGKGRQIGQNYCFQGIYKNGKRIQGIFKYNVCKQADYFEVQSQYNPFYWKEPQPVKYDYQYQGKFNNETKFTGKSRLKGPKGQYNGQFLNGKKHGYAQFIFKSGMRYVGNYYNNQRSGEGTLYTETNKIRYSGHWQDDLPDGQGFIINQSGQKIQVNLKKGIRIDCLDQNQ